MARLIPEQPSALLSVSCTANDATPAAHVSAINAILDRGLGKTTQPIENGEDGVLELTDRIERIIDHTAGSIKILVWNQVLGVGSTDLLAEFAPITANLVAS